MSPNEAKAIGHRAMKLWPTTINAEQAGVLVARLVLLNIPADSANGVLDAECATPTTAKVGRVAALVARFEAEHRQARTAMTTSAGTGEHPVDRLCREILTLQARSRERMGEPYARAVAWKLWTTWRNALADAGMTLADATDWLVANTEVEHGWVDALEAKYAAGRARQAARMARMRDGFAPSLPAARKAPGFYTRGEPQIGAVI